jgi:hypothetical protein
MERTVGRAPFADLARRVGCCRRREGLRPQRVGHERSAEGRHGTFVGRHHGDPLLGLTKEIEMSDLTTMTMAVHKVATMESQHPVHAMAFDLALEKRLARRARWGRLRGRRHTVTARREAALGSGC